MNKASRILLFIVQQLKAVEKELSALQLLTFPENFEGISRMSRIEAGQARKVCEKRWFKN